MRTDTPASPTRRSPMRRRPRDLVERALRTARAAPPARAAASSSRTMQVPRAAARSRAPCRRPRCLNTSPSECAGSVDSSSTRPRRVRAREPQRRGGRDGRLADAAFAAEEQERCAVERVQRFRRRRARRPSGLQRRALQRADGVARRAPPSARAEPLSACAIARRIARAPQRRAAPRIAAGTTRTRRPRPSRRRIAASTRRSSRPAPIADRTRRRRPAARD